MKSTFGRSFSVFAGILLVALTVLGGSFQVMVQDFLTDTTFDSLEQDAQIIADLAASYMEDDSLSGREFLMNLDIASKVSGSDAVICNSDGKVTICSDSLFGCKHMGLYVNEEYLQKVLSQGSDRATGLIKGLYSEERFLVALPVTAADGDRGIIIVSSPSASVNQVLERGGKLHKLYRFKDLELDGENRVLRRGGETIVLPPMEFDVLMVLMKNKNRTVSRQQILSEIWGYEYFGDLRTVDVRIANLRKKLNLAEEIRTIPRTGYRLEEL